MKVIKIQKDQVTILAPTPTGEILLFCKIIHAESVTGELRSALKEKCCEDEKLAQFPDSKTLCEAVTTTMSAPTPECELKECTEMEKPVDTNE